MGGKLGRAGLKRWALKAYLIDASVGEFHREGAVPLKTPLHPSFCAGVISFCPFIPSICLP